MRMALVVWSTAIGLLGAASAASAAATTFTITGSAGKDEVSIDERRDERSGNSILVIQPAMPVAVVGPESCAPVTDPLTGRARETRCSTNGSFDLVVDVAGGDDVLSIGLDQTDAESVTAAGGAGADVLALAAPRAQTLRGGDGDDALVTNGGGDGATIDGGAGRDLLDYGSNGPIPGGSVPGGVSASLQSNRARWVYGRHPTFGEQARSDAIAAIERLSGTPNGDSLTGGAGADELIGEGGPDDLAGGDGNDFLAGGDGDDLLVGGDGTDTLDGGKHADVFRPSPGGDTIQARDGFAERMTCSAGEAVVNDLVDGLDNAAGCRSVATAAAKHRFDTRLTRKRLRVSARRRVGVRIACTRRKPEACAGVLALRRGGPRGRVLARGRYRMRPGRETVLELSLSRTEARAARRRAATLEAKEIDGDGRDRRVLRKTRFR